MELKIVEGLCVDCLEPCEAILETDVTSNCCGAMVRDHDRTLITLPQFIPDQVDIGRNPIAGLKPTLKLYDVEYGIVAIFFNEDKANEFMEQHKDVGVLWHQRGNGAIVLARNDDKGGNYVETSG